MMSPVTKTRLKCQGQKKDPCEDLHSLDVTDLQTTVGEKYCFTTLRYYVVNFLFNILYKSVIMFYVMLKLAMEP